MNKTVPLFFIIFSLLAISACSNKQAYNAMQNNQRIECRKLPPTQIDQCLEENKQSYEEYKKEHEDYIEKET